MYLASITVSIVSYHVAQINLKLVIILAHPIRVRIIGMYHMISEKIVLFNHMSSIQAVMMMSGEDVMLVLVLVVLMLVVSVMVLVLVVMLVV